MNCPLLIGIKSDGSVYFGLTRADFNNSGITFASKFELRPGFSFGKAFTLSGSSGSYALANANHVDHGNQHAVAF
jgi:hypothetical protein